MIGRIRKCLRRSGDRPPISKPFAIYVKVWTRDLHVVGIPMRSAAEVNAR